MAATDSGSNDAGRRSLTEVLRSGGRILVMALAVGISLAMAAPVSADAPTPPIPADLPSEIEDFAPYQPQRSCDPAAKAGVVAFAHMLLAVYENTGSSGISRGCSIGGTSEHKEGRAFDWDVSVTNAAERRQAEALLGWLFADRGGHEAAMARRLGIMYVIWDHKIWGSYKADQGWRPYSGSNPHTDHVHFSFDWAGACKITSYWDGTVASGPGSPPCGSADLSKGRALPSGWLRKTTSPGASAGDFTAAVAALQRLLGVPVDGERGPGTVAAIRAFQRSHGLAVDGIAGPKTWAALREAKLESAGVAEQRYTQSVATLQRLLDVTVDGRYGPSTEAAVKDFQRSHGLAVDGIAGPKTWTALTGSPGRASERYSSSVAALQRLLGVPVDGERGPGTVAAIRAFQRSHGLAVDGIAGPKTWAALREAKLESAGVAEQRYTQSVATLQRLLDVTVDGRYGPSTEAAVKDFQRSHGLAVDGIAGPKTWTALRSTE